MDISIDEQNMFEGIIGEEYQSLKLICPLATQMTHLVGATVGEYCKQNPQAEKVLELGGGTGITTLAMLSANQNIIITSIDNAKAMQEQAKQSLQRWYQKGRLKFILQDALTALKAMPDNSVDIIASAYTLHNFINTYRFDVLKECYRVLKSGGQFINGDRYALDDVVQHTQEIQNEISGYFKVFIKEQRLDLLEHWLLHLYSDEAEHHIMREAVAIQQLQQAGFENIKVSNRITVNALVTANKL